MVYRSNYSIHYRICFGKLYGFRNIRRLYISSIDSNTGKRFGTSGNTCDYGRRANNILLRRQCRADFFFTFGKCLVDRRDNAIRDCYCGGKLYSSQ